MDGNCDEEEMNEECSEYVKNGSSDWDNSILLHNSQKDEDMINSEKAFIPNKRQMNKAKTHTCGVCGKTFRFFSRLKIHNILHTGEKPFKCNVCGTGFTQSRSLINHKKKHDLSAKAIECTLCEKTFVSKWTLSKHLKLKHSDCVSLDKEIMKSSDKEEKFVSNNAKKRIRERIHSCNVCGKAFNMFSRFRMHCMTHTGEKPFKCDICGTGFIQRSSMMYHMQRHDANVKPLECPLCGKSYVTKYTLSKHLKRHNGEKNCECKICHKQFFEKFSLDVHMRKHTREKPFQCDICNRSFAQTGGLQLHRRIHTGEKPYQCTVCGKTFAVITKQKLHMRVHSEERKYSCLKCDKKFAYRHSLKRHMVSHEATEKPLECKFCKEVLTDQQSLQIHVRSTHRTGSITRVQCKYCTKSYNFRTSLHRHIKKNHSYELAYTKTETIDDT